MFNIRRVFSGRHRHALAKAGIASNPFKFLPHWASAWAVLIGILVLVASNSNVSAQTVAPSQVTPETFRPATPPLVQDLVLPQGESLQAPPGSADLKVHVGAVRIEGGFPELSAKTAQLVSTIEKQFVSVAQIYQFAQTLENEYARAGYVLVRVSVPQQRLIRDSVVRIVVVDGFIEAVNTEGVPNRLQSLVAARTADLVGRHHVTIAEIERRTLLAGDASGLSLKSTLARGQQDGGTILIFEGTHQLVSGSIGLENRLPVSLGTWGPTFSISLNSAFGMGEQVYATLGSSKNLQQAFDGAPALQTLGAGAVIPLGLDGLTLNPEYASSVTRPEPVAGVPRTIAHFDRAALRITYPYLRTRGESINLTAGLESLNQKNEAFDFGVTLSQDKYSSLRLGGNWSRQFVTGRMMLLSANLSKGLGGRSQADALDSGIALSRQGATPNFTKLNGQMQMMQPLPSGFGLMVDVNAQSSFGKPLLTSERMGFDAVSAFEQGTLVADEGVSVRVELSKVFQASSPMGPATVSPYVFGAAARGYARQATAVEVERLDAQAVGIGVRSSFDTPLSPSGASFSIEFGRGASNTPELSTAYRTNVSFNVKF